MTEETDKTMADYYARRASEYERVYLKPERQADLRRLADLLSSVFAGHDVLEVACGTGYWTQFIAKSARRIVATDINPEVLNIARRKDYASCRVRFLESDAYSLAKVQSRCTAGFHGFWWSHIPNQKIGAFLDRFHSALPKDAMVVMIDNSYVEGSSTPISRRDKHGNTFQIRKLQDGSKHEVLKNFPSPSELRTTLQPHANDVQVTQLDYYWMVRYRKRGQSNQSMNWTAQPP
jgi:demethylmenaquinone methyltransferase/2-methoxy-6-polyprenyl-1,4-benzoquinol methylase